MFTRNIFRFAFLFVALLALLNCGLTACQAQAQAEHQTPQQLLHKVPIRNAAARFALANDGTEQFFYFLPSSLGDTAPWMLYLEGGWCTNKQTKSKKGSKIQRHSFGGFFIYFCLFYLHLHLFLILMFMCLMQKGASTRKRAPAGTKTRKRSCHRPRAPRRSRRPESFRATRRGIRSLPTQILPTCRT